MNPFYVEEKWDPDAGLDIFRVFRKGDAKHFAVFYDKGRLDEYMDLLRSYYYNPKNHFAINNGGNLYAYNKGEMSQA